MIVFDPESGEPIRDTDLEPVVDEKLSDEDYEEAKILYEMMENYGVDPADMDPADLELIDRFLAEEGEFEEDAEEELKRYFESQGEVYDDGPLTPEEEQLPLELGPEEPVGKKHRRKQMMSGHGYSQSNYRPPADRDNLICPPAGIVRVMNPDGTQHAAFRIDEVSRWWFRNALMAYADHVHRMGDDTVIDIPLDKALIEYTTPGFSSCTFDSTSDYLVSLFGIKLHQTDKTWMSRHPYAEEMGVPQEYTPTAIQGLIEPYGLKVARIRVRKEAWFTGNPLEQWMAALGCNPFALVDHATSNAEAAEKLGITPQEAHEMFRFEFSEWPLRPSILGERSDLGVASGATTGKRGGHARYLAPREGNGQWFLSLQLEWAHLVEYNAPVVLPEYVPRPDIMKLNLYRTKAPDGSDVDHRKWYDAWVAAGMPGKPEGVEVEVTPPRPMIEVVRGSGSLTSSTPSGTGTTHKGGVTQWTVFDPNKQVDALKAYYDKPGQPRGVQSRCASCGQWRSDKVFVEGMEQVCLGCYIKAWEGFNCPNKGCETRFEATALPRIHVGGICWSCPKCFTRMHNGLDEGLNRLAGLIVVPDSERKGERRASWTDANGEKHYYWTHH